MTTRGGYAQDILRVSGFRPTTTGAARFPPPKVVPVARPEYLVDRKGEEKGLNDPRSSRRLIIWHIFFIFVPYFRERASYRPERGVGCDLFCLKN